MKHTGIHILDFNDKIIDFISQSEGALSSGYEHECQMGTLKQVTLPY